ncbi:hypothetical protein COB72_08495 [bacterium]|nr:MAG: hypothetical protein COB72_08495 [bacterium]
MFRSLISTGYFSVLACVVGAASALGSGPEHQCGAADGSRPRVLQAETFDLVDSLGGGLCDECVIELHILVDVRLADELADTVQAYVDDIVARMNETWSRPFSEGGLGLGVVLSELTVFADGDPWAASADAFAMLNNVNSYVNANIPINPDGRDAVIMLSGVDFDIALGAGFVGRLCRSSAVGVVQAIFFQNEFVASLANHQLGHIAGSLHDGSTGSSVCSSNDFIMSAPNSSLPVDRYSGCSISEIVGHVFSPGFDTLSCLSLPVLPCPADLTGDRLLNFFDISEFLQAFSGGDLLADFTGDGLLNFFDISEFLIEFAAGCP